MSIDVDNAFCVDKEGICLVDDDGNKLLYLTAGTGSPIGSAAPVPTLYIEDNGDKWLHHDTGVNDWIKVGPLFQVDGTEAIQATIDGDARGNNSTDLQTTRVSTDQVAAGQRNFIGGGENNKTTSNNTAIVTGQGNEIKASSGQSVIAGGISNVVGNTSGGTSNFIGAGVTNIVDTGGAQSITGGQLNTVRGTFFNHIGNGFTNTIDGTQNNSILNGSTNTVGTGAIASQILNGISCQNSAIIASIVNGSACIINTGATASTILNGGNNVVNTGVLGSTIINGFGSVSTHSFQVLLNGIVRGSRPMEVLQSGGNFGTAASASLGHVGMTATTTDATPTNLQINPVIAAAQEFTIPQDHTVGAHVIVTARSSSGADHAMWNFDALIEDTGGTLTLVSPGVAIMPTHNTVGAAAWTITPSAAGGALRLAVVGAAATNIRWNAFLKYSEVEFA